MSSIFLIFVKNLMLISGSLPPWFELRFHSFDSWFQTLRVGCGVMGELAMKRGGWGVECGL